jgi:hypothetical protein
MTDFSSGKCEHSTFLSFLCSGPMLRRHLLTTTYIIDKCQGIFYNISIMAIGNTGIASIKSLLSRQNVSFDLFEELLFDGWKTFLKFLFVSQTLIIWSNSK